MIRLFCEEYKGYLLSAISYADEIEYNIKNEISNKNVCFGARPIKSINPLVLKKQLKQYVDKHFIFDSECFELN